MEYFESQTSEHLESNLRMQNARNTRLPMRP